MIKASVKNGGDAQHGCCPDTEATRHVEIVAMSKTKKRPRIESHTTMLIGHAEAINMQERLVDRFVGHGRPSRQTYKSVDCFDHEVLKQF